MGSIRISTNPATPPSSPCSRKVRGRQVDLAIDLARRLLRSLVAPRDASFQALRRRNPARSPSRSSSKSAKTRSQIRIRSSSPPSPKNSTPPRAAAINRRSQSRVLRAARAEPSLCLRANRATLRQPARARSRRQPQGLRVGNPGRGSTARSTSCNARAPLIFSGPGVRAGCSS